MKKYYVLLSLLALPFFLTAQIVDSDCTVPQALLDNYEWDVKDLAYNRMIASGDPAINQVDFPQNVLDTIWEGLAAIINADVLPERDSVFNMYCVHNGTFHPVTYSIIVSLDESYDWTTNWQNNELITGEPLMDYITQTYSLSLSSYTSFALLETTELWNTRALCDSLGLVPGVSYAEPNYLIGGAGRITYEYQEDLNLRKYEFHMQWNDCFDGCDNGYGWHFSVYDDCSVEFTGTSQYGFFQVEPLPAPINCYDFITGTDLPPTQNKYRLSPNPATDYFTIHNLDIDNTAEIEIINLAGQVLLKKEVQAGNQIDVSTLDAGLYFVQISEKNGNFEVQKIIIQ